MTAPLLDVAGLRVGFMAADGTAVEAVRGIDLRVAPGEAVGLVGESGSGKSLTALALLRLVAPPGRILGGSVRLGGTELLDLPEPAMRRVRGGQVAMVFQDPQAALNPAVSIGRHLHDVIRRHRGLSGGAARREAVAALDQVGIPQAAARLGAYPHEFSGGMRQRVLIAMAIACRPRLLVADEPTTALDVTVQAGIVRLLAELRQELGLGLLFISHNLDLVAEVVDRVAVMYGGKVVEDGPVAQVFDHPRHPYSRLLQACVPRLDGGALVGIEGSPPRLGRMPPGCPFSPRCPSAGPDCAEMPPFTPAPGGRFACWHPC